MKRRCLSVDDPSYFNYGGRGISVCDDWLNFKAFHKWAYENGFEEGLTLERIDVDGNYEPSNCKWIPKSMQSENTRKCKFITYQGETKILKHWAKELGMSYHALQHRLNRGWTVEEAFNTPIRAQK